MWDDRHLLFIASKQSFLNSNPRFPSKGEKQIQTESNIIGKVTIQMQEEQRCSSCFCCGNKTAGGGRREKMAKFLNYEDRLEIESGLKEHMTFTEIGKKLGRDRTTITKEIRNYSVEQDTGYSIYPHNTCKYRKTCKRKKVCGTNDCKHPLVTVCKQ